MLFLSPPTYLLNTMASTTQTLPQLKSHERIGHMQNRFFTTSPLMCHQWH